VLTVARQLARQKQQDSQFAGALTVLGVPRRRQPAIRTLLDSRWGSVKFAHNSADLMTTVAREDGKVLVWSAHEPHDLSSRATAQGVPLWRISPGSATASLVLRHSDDEEQQLVQVRGMPCSQQQALEHNARPNPGLLDSCPRYRQVRRYLKGML
jgi:capsular polysaccharide export protein